MDEIKDGFAELWRDGIRFEAEKQEIFWRYRVLRAAKIQKRAERKAIEGLRCGAGGAQGHPAKRGLHLPPHRRRPRRGGKWGWARPAWLRALARHGGRHHDDLDDIEQMFGVKERVIVDGLTKMSGVFEPGTSAQAENFRRCCSH